MITPSIEHRRSLLQRVAGAAALDAAVYEEVEADRRATWQAVAVILVSSLAAGVGARGFGAVGPGDVLFFTGIALMAWVAWAFVVYAVGSGPMAQPQTRADMGQVLRTIGFATAPGVVRLLGVIPALALPVFVGAAVWMLLAMIVAVRQSLDFTSTRRAVAVCVLGWVLAVVFGSVVGFFFGPRVS